MVLTVAHMMRMPESESAIDDAAKKFKEYEGQPCVLVLYNNDAALVDIVTPDIVLGAMYGNVWRSRPI